MSSPALKGRRKRRAELRANLLGILQVVFAALIIIVFILAFVIQSQAIVLPEWTKTFQGVSPDKQSEYAAALLTVIIVITFVIVSAGIYLARHVM